jgi:hypothetical protein
MLLVLVELVVFFKRSFIMSEFKFEPMDMDEIKKEGDRICRKSSVVKTEEKLNLNYLKHKKVPIISNFKMLNTRITGGQNYVNIPNYYSIYRDVLVYWDEDKDARILCFIDEMHEVHRKILLSVSERKGTIVLCWNGVIPDLYKEGEEIECCGDYWSISESFSIKVDYPNPVEEISITITSYF